MRTLYLDIFSGLSGDMFLGALIDLGVDFRDLERELRKLRLPGYHLHVSKSQRSAIAGTKFDVHLEESGHDCDHDHTHEHEPSHSHGNDSRHSHGGPSHSHTDESGSHSHAHENTRDFSAIRAMIEASTLSTWVKEKSIAVFHRIAVAEGKVHGVAPDKVHFHEVGAIDSIVDIVGGCIGLELLGHPRVTAGPVVEGTGFVRCAHGRFPLPATATLEILGARGIPLTQCEEPNELLTPTGAALLAEFAESFGPMGALVASKVGYGLGTRENKTRPNVVRAVLSEDSGATVSHDWETDTVAVIETNLDDVDGEILGHFLERALRLGALDVFHTPIQMKKSRPGVLLTVLCKPEDADEFSAMLLTETSAFGIRRHLAERRKLRREIVEVKTPLGAVKVKLGRLDGKIVQAAPEYESCKGLAAMAGVPLSEVYSAARRAAEGR
ncbi:MAG TPA: nickel pincer cofactor biosynthesis protein LarC [Candidatus Limnocylindria bacterium]|nr:nickel pincer cofactor biosynthesis protein LarC [Candidatus Limnocylindria bacterium]